MNPVILWFAGDGNGGRSGGKRIKNNDTKSKGNYTRSRGYHKDFPGNTVGTLSSSNESMLNFMETHFVLNANYHIINVFDFAVISNEPKESSGTEWHSRPLRILLLLVTIYFTMNR